MRCQESMPVAFGLLETLLRAGAVQSYLATCAMYCACLVGREVCLLPAVHCKMQDQARSTKDVIGRGAQPIVSCVIKINMLRAKRLTAAMLWEA